MIDELNAESTVETPAVEQAAESTPAESTGLSGREAIAESLKRHREAPQSTQPTDREVVQAVNADPEPPAEFTAAGKAAWKNKDLSAIQKEYRRIHDSRTAEVSRAQKAEREAREDAKTWRELGKMAAPYIEARGAEGVTPDKAIMEALALVNEFKKGDPAQVKAELLRIGIDLDKAPEQTGRELDPAIEALQKRVDELTSREQQQEFEKTRQSFDVVFNNLLAQKNRTGSPMFPDLLDDSEAGQKLAGDIGSLASNPVFINGVRRGFPDADFSIVVREAYKAAGGRVSGDTATVSAQNQQRHLEKSRRASAAVPGRTAPRVNDSNLAGKLSNRAALAKAWELHKGS